MLDEESWRSKVQYLHGKRVRICGGHKCEGRCALPGEVSRCAIGYRYREMRGSDGRSQPRP